MSKKTPYEEKEQTLHLKADEYEAETESAEEETKTTSDEESEDDYDEESETGLMTVSRFTRSEDTRSNMSLREILGGDILNATWLRRQIGLICLCVMFVVIYITNRYSSQQEIIEIEVLKEQLQDIKYRALTRSGELTVKCRQSNLEEQLKLHGDSTLTVAKEPPFILLKPREE